MAILQAPGSRSRPGYASSKFYLYPRRGRLVASVWPRKRPTRPTLDERERRERFRQASLLYKYLTGREREAVEQAVKGTPYLARDLHFKLLYGTMFWLNTNDGRSIYPMSFIEDVSTSIDALGQTPGDLLLRGDPYWGRIPVGNEGDALQVIGGVPSWSSPPGSGPGSAVELDSIALGGTPQATIDFSWSAPYDEIAVFGWFVPPSAGGPILICNLSTDGGTTFIQSTGAYSITRQRYGPDWAHNIFSNKNDPNFFLAEMTGSVLSSRALLDLRLLFPSDSGTPTQYDSLTHVIDSAYALNLVHGNGVRKALENNNAVRIWFHDGSAFRDAHLVLLGINWF